MLERLLAELWAELRAEPPAVLAEESTLESELLMLEILEAAEEVTLAALLERLELMEEETLAREEDSLERLLAEEEADEAAAEAEEEDWAEAAATRTVRARNLNCMVAEVCGVWVGRER